MDLIYLDCFSGVSGDMMVGALLDCGADWNHVAAGISSLGLEATVSVHKQIRSGISCSSFVVAAEAAPLRHLGQILAIITAGSLSPAVKTKSIDVFNKIAAAEATVHGIDIEEVHFHEIGAVDTIIDVVSAFLCLESMEIEDVFASSLPWSQGLVDCSHGRFPVPAPATALLLKGYPCYPVAVQMELVTPTGAALLASMAVHQAQLHSFIPVRIGYGAGLLSRDDNVPNLLRAVRAISPESPCSQDDVGIIETEVDDLKPEVFSHLHRILSKHPSVLDHFTTAVFMKKNRPGNLITVLVKPAAIEEVSRLLIRETGTLGVRHRLQKRIIASRREDILETDWGPVRIKISCISPDEVHTKPEFEDCAAIAQRENLPLLKVYEIISASLHTRYR